MKLNLKGNVKKDVNGQKAGGFVKTTALRDFPIVAIRVKRFGERQGYKVPDNNTDPSKKQDYVVGDFIALNNNNEVVYQLQDGLWAINRSVKEDGTVNPGVLFRIFDTSTSNYFMIGSIDLKQSKNGNEFNAWSDAILNDEQTAILENAFEALEEGGPQPVNNNAGQEETPPWSETIAEEKPPF